MLYKFILYKDKQNTRVRLSFYAYVLIDCAMIYTTTSLTTEVSKRAPDCQTQIYALVGGAPANPPLPPR